MNTNYLTIQLKITWLVTGYEDYCFCEDKKLYNMKRCKQIKQVYNSGVIGFNLNGKFLSLDKIRPLLIKPIVSECPF